MQVHIPDKMASACFSFHLKLHDSNKVIRSDRQKQYNGSAVDFEESERVEMYFLVVDLINEILQLLMSLAENVQRLLKPVTGG